MSALPSSELPTEPGDAIPLRLIATDAIRYWEPRRLVYNVVLLGIVAGQVVHAWPASRRALNAGTAMPLFVLAAIANILYCTAYPIDIFVQVSAYRDRWRRTRGTRRCSIRRPRSGPGDRLSGAGRMPWRCHSKTTALMQWSVSSA
jgi:hypothetical protein